ncbi:MAG: putative porin [Elusimicrobia bacterium]|nr:putative porin [Elusimicrobiota bacterium]
MNRLLATATLLAALAPAAFAADANDLMRFASHLQQVRLKGDLRLRHESIIRKGPAGAAVAPNNASDRGRARYRLRVGVEFELPEDVVAAVRLGAGGGEQTSNNQTFDNLGSQKGIFVDEAYARWSPRVGENTVLRLGGGKTPNWLWRTESADLIWDGDFDPEGFQESVEWLSPLGVSVFVNALQMVADEDAGTYRNQFLFSQQAGFETRLPFESRLRTAFAYHKWSDENHSNFAQVAFGDGNRRATLGGSAGTLVNRFGVGEWTSELSGWVRRIPVRGQLTLARNLRARSDLPGPRARDGYQVGVIIGRAKLRGQMEFGAFKKYSQTDVTVADLADSDFGDGGTNRRGGIFWLAYALRDWAGVKAKYFVTDVIDKDNLGTAPAGLAGFSLGPGDKPVNRLQLDFQISF